MDKMTGFTCGAWDLLHTGHVMFLRKCKERCDYLAVGLHVDPSLERKEKNKPVQSILERVTQLEACKYVDAVIVYETEEDLRFILNNRNIDVRFLGSDYDNPKAKITAKSAVPIEYIPRTHKFSTSELRKRVKKQTK